MKCLSNKKIYWVIVSLMLFFVCALLSINLIFGLKEKAIVVFIISLVLLFFDTIFLVLHNKRVFYYIYDKLSKIPKNPVLTETFESLENVGCEKAFNGVKKNNDCFYYDYNNIICDNSHYFYSIGIIFNLRRIGFAYPSFCINILM